MIAAGNDEVLDAIDRAATFADRDWSRETRTARPSAIMAIRYCMMMADGHADEARRIANGWLNRLRAEYRTLAGKDVEP